MREFSTGITPGSTPLDVTEADGDLWFTEFNSGDLGEITPQGTVHEFLLSSPGLFSITADDGYLWITNPNENTIYRVAPSECLATLHGCDNTLAIGLENRGFTGEPGSIAAGPDGNVWFADGSGLGRITPSTTPPVVTVTAFPQAGTPADSGSSQLISSGPDSTLWYAQAAGSLGEVSFCSAILCGGELTVSGGSAELSGSLHQASTIGILIRRRERRRLLPVGHVPLGHHHAGPFHLRWNLRVDGRRLSAGRYTITLRALNHHKQVIDKTKPVMITIGR